MILKNPPLPCRTRKPLFVPQATELIAILKQKSPQDIATLMSLSDTLAGLNVARYQAWGPKFTAKNAKQAVLAFNGDVYEGLDAKTLAAEDLAWAQDHVCILSGLYGVLRPLDDMQPYRLEMGTKLPNRHGKDLYQFWGTISDYLDTRLQQGSPGDGEPGRKEYFKAVDRSAAGPGDRLRLPDSGRPVQSSAFTPNGRAA